MENLSDEELIVKFVWSFFRNSEEAESLEYELLLRLKRGRKAMDDMKKISKICEDAKFSLENFRSTKIPVETSYNN